MSIEMKCPKDAKEAVDAAWNHVGQLRIAIMIGHKSHVESSLFEIDRLLSVAMQYLEEVAK